MHRVVPELIVEKYRQGEFSGEFEAVGLFLDLSGFSRMTDELMQHGQHGAEVLAYLMQSVFDPLVENIFNYGGKIVSFAGDGIMALFPLNGDAKTTALYALASAWTVQRALLENPERQTVYGNFKFSVKVGLTCGAVSWGILCSVDGRNATYYFRGSAVDESALAEHAAQAGQVILTDSLRAVMQDEIQVSPHGSFYRLEGFCVEMPDPVPILFPPIDLEISRLFMPEEVIAHNMRGEFRQIVNLFIRFPDLSHRELQDLAQVVFELHEKYGGLVNRLDFGDKGCNMLSLWGAPVTYENDIGRALNFVLELKARLPFPVTAGVTYYVAHAGYLGSAMCEDYTCYGWGVNLASRFMMTAPLGGIWIDERVARRVKNRFDFEPRGAQNFKGFAAEQKVFALIGRKMQEVFFQGEFVGREVELPLLVDCLELLWQRRFAGVIVIRGDAGIGKSRLVYEVKASFPRQGQAVLWALCHSDQILRHSFNPFRYWLLRYFGIDSNMDDAAQKRAFETNLDRLIARVPDPELAGELERIRSVLGALLDLHWRDSFYEQLDAEGRYNNTLNAMIALIRAESLCQPVVLFIEDAQFIDEDTRAFLPRLKNALSAGEVEYPVAIVVSTRQAGSGPNLDASLADRTIELGPLSLQALSDLAEVYLGGVPSPELVHLVETRSEGNPYFAEQILVYLQEENLLEMSQAGWQVTSQLKDSSLPADIRALLVARLDQLPRHVRDVIQTAAVLGREFEVQVLSSMVRQEGDLSEELFEAEHASIWVSLNPHRYGFTHGLLRDAAYAMQMRARRTELHAAALEALEKFHGAEMEHHFGELAHHAERARLSDKALHYLRQAGVTSASAYQNSLAVDYYTRALGFVPAGDLFPKFDIVTQRVELYARMGKRDLQWKDLNALEQWAEALGDMQRFASVLMLRASYYFATGDYLNAINASRQAELHAPSMGDTELSLYTQVVWAMSLLRLGQLEEAMRHAQVTLVRDQHAGNRKEECRIRNAMGLIALEQKESASARAHFTEARLIAREVKDLGLETRVLNNLAMVEGYLNGDYARAREYYEKSYALARETGDRAAQSIALGNLGFAAGMQGDFVAARSYHEQALSISREIGNRNQEINTLINLSAVEGMQNEGPLALQHARQAAELSRKVSDRSGEAWAMLYVGHACLAQSQLPEAQAAYRRSVEIRLELNQPALSMEPIAGLVETYLCTNDPASATHEAEKILQFLESGSTLDGVEEPLRIYRTCYLLLEQKQDPRSQRILREAVQLLEAQVSKFSDEAARKRYVENIPWRKAIWEAGRVNPS